MQRHIKTLDAPVAANAALKRGLLSVAGVDMRIALIDSASRQAYNAGTPGVYTVDLSGAASRAKISFNSNVLPLQFAGFGTSANDIATQIAAAITANPEVKATATAAAGVVTITQTDVTEPAFNITAEAELVQVAPGVTTAHVQAVGTPAQVTAEGGVGSAGAEYDRWAFGYLDPSKGPEGSTQFAPRVLIVFANTQGAGHGAFLAALNAALDGSAGAANYGGVKNYVVNGSEV